MARIGRFHLATKAFQPVLRRIIEAEALSCVKQANLLLYQKGKNRRRTVTHFVTKRQPRFWSFRDLMRDKIIATRIGALLTIRDIYRYVHG
jgi:hypothetical protein